LPDAEGSIGGRPKPGVIPNRDIGSLRTHEWDRGMGTAG
jgi:hypothetical protein